MAACPFCKIARGETRSDIVHQDGQVTAFRDINPQAPIHILIVPNKHIAGLNDLGDEDQPLAGRMFSVARDLARREGLAGPGYRLVVNTGPQAGQSVHHLHLHLLGGRAMRWPPG